MPAACSSLRSSPTPPRSSTIGSKYSGSSSRVSRTGGSGTASWYSHNGIATVDALGPYQITIHTLDERMKISSIEKKIALFATVLGCME